MGKSLYATKVNLLILEGKLIIFIMEYYYTTERNAQILISLLKQYGIKRIVVSPGSTNANIVISMQQDPFFELYSAADERSAAYISCGIAEETGEPVVISCTGATASRNYIPGLTEAYYRKLPIIAVTSTHTLNKVGHLVPQTLDRSVIPNDIAIKSVHLNNVSTFEDEYLTTIKVNNALNSLFLNGGGPVHINIETSYSYDFSAKNLPKAKLIKKYIEHNNLPTLPKGRISIFIGSHKRFTEEQTRLIDQFCAENDAVAFCDHTSGYSGAYQFQCALVGCQAGYDKAIFKTDLTIHIGEVSGNYPGFSSLRKAKQVWRVSEDGEMRDFANNLTAVFAMPESNFFKYYIRETNEKKDSYFKDCQNLYNSLLSSLEKKDLPFSNGWIAMQLSDALPHGSSLYLGILNSLRNWNFFKLHKSIFSSSNVGGFGIDGGLSTLVGASITNPNKLYFGVFGDLAFFYDINVLANRHVGHNVRILLINNGKGAEFRMYSHKASIIGSDADDYVAASGHYGNKSPHLVHHFAEDCGYKYIHAETKEEFLSNYKQFVDPVITQSIIFEVFTSSEDESESLKIIDHLMFSESQVYRKDFAKNVIVDLLGKNNVFRVKNLLK